VGTALRRSNAHRTTPGTGRGRRPFLLLLLLALALVLVACSGSEDAGLDSAQRDAPATVTEEAEEQAAQAPDVADDLDAGPSEGLDGPPAPGAGADSRNGDALAAAASERAVIRTARMHIRARDTAAAAEGIVAQAEEVGGYVAGTDLRRDAEGVVSGRLTLRVPSAELTATLDAIDALADSVVERRLDEEDVTAQLSDLEAQITNLEAYETELRELLREVREASPDTEELLQVFDRVNEVRGQIDRLTAQRAVLSDQVALSTIHVELSPTAATGPVANPGWDPGGTARGALATTVRILTDLADAAIVVTVTAVPVLLVFLLPIAVVVVIVRGVRRSRGRATATPPHTNDNATADDNTTDDNATPDQPHA